LSKIHRDPLDPGVVRCTECAREADELATIAERWTWWSDGVGELLPYCPSCSEREFGHVLPATKDRRHGSQ
jgi:hypothetical protein